MLPGHPSAVDQVVDDPPGSHGLSSRALSGHVVDLPDLHRLHPAVLLQPDDIERLNLAPPVRGSALHNELSGAHDQVRLDPPAVFSRQIQLHSQVRQVAFRRSVVGPCLDHRQLHVRQRRVLLVLLDAEVLLHVPRRHRAHPVPDRRLRLDPPGVPSHLLVARQRHGTRSTRAVAVHAAPREYRRDVLRERHPCGIPAEVRGREEVRLVVTRYVGLGRQRRRHT